MLRSHFKRFVLAGALARDGVKVQQLDVLRLALFTLDEELVDILRCERLFDIGWINSFYLLHFLPLQQPLLLFQFFRLQHTK